MHTARSSHALRSRGWLVAAAALFGGCAIVTGTPDEGAVVPAQGPVSLDPNPTLTAPDSDHAAVPLRPPVEPEAFAVGVQRAAAGEHAYAIPALEVPDGTGLYLTVRTLVGLASRVDGDHLLAQDTSCDQRDTASCSLQFERLVASHDGTLNTALAPYAHLVNESATDVQVVTWIPVRDGYPQAPVTTIQGIRGGRILGVAVFHQPRD